MGSKNGEAELDIVRQFHDEAYVHVEQGLSLEEADQPAAAMASYEKGLRLLEQGLSLTTNNPNYMGDKWDNVRLLQMKMRKTKDHVLSRLEDLSKERGGIACPPYEPVPLELPPSYEEACNGASNSRVDSEALSPSVSNQSKADCKSYGDVLNMLQPMDAEQMRPFSAMPVEAERIFTIRDGVQIFFISPNGQVSAPCYPTTLHVYKFSNGRRASQNSRNPAAFLQVGEWNFPLHPGQIPVIHTLYGAYVMPDTTAEQPGSAVGILLSEDISESIRQMFEHLMCELAAVRNECSQAAPQDKLSTKISNGIIVGAEYVSKGVVYGAEMSSEYVRLAAKKLRERMAPPNSPTYVDPRVQRGFQIAKDASEVAVKVSGYLLSRLAQATMAIGQQLAPHVRTHGTRLLSKAIGEDEPEKANAAMDSVCEVAYGGIKGFSTVYLGLEQAATILAKSLVSETVQTVDHRYGAEASHTTGNTLMAVGNLALTAHNVHNMGVKAVVKNAVKSTGKAVVNDYVGKKGELNSEQNEKK